MANKLDAMLQRYDALIAQSVQQNFYSDTAPYSKALHNALERLDTFQPTAPHESSLETFPRPALRAPEVATDKTQQATDVPALAQGRGVVAQADGLVISPVASGRGVVAQDDSLQIPTLPAADKLVTQDAQLVVPRPNPSDLTQQVQPNTNDYNDAKHYDVRGGKLASLPVPAKDNLRSSANSYSDVKPFSPIASASPNGVGPFDVFAIANWLRNIGQEFGALPRPGESVPSTKGLAKGAQFLATQFLLASFNPADANVGGAANRLYNPLHLPLSAVPGLRGTTNANSPNAAAALPTGDYERRTLTAPDRMILLRQGVYQRVPGPADFVQLNVPKPGFLGDIAPQGKPIAELPISVQGQVDQEGPTALLAAFSPVQKNIYTPQNPYSKGPVIDMTALEERAKLSPLTVQQIQLAELFQPDVSKPLDPTRTSWIPRPRRESESLNYGYSVSVASFPDNVDVSFGRRERDGLIAESNPIPDSQNYMPFYFQDLRDTTPQLLYFRAFLHDGLEENFAPNWNSENFYGRVDEVPTYTGTGRTLSLVFDIVAWSPKDLAPMYTKLHKLQSLVYPSYDSNAYLQAGPLVRMRIGDLICAQSPNASAAKKGLPGYINTLSFAYDEIWNITEDYKVPRKVSVTLGYTVVHEGNPGIYPFSSIDANTPNAAGVPNVAGPQFGVLSAPSNGTSNVDVAGVRGIMSTIAKLPRIL